MSDLLILRHAPTDWNEARRLQGRTDRPLSEAGRAALDRLRLPDPWQDAALVASPLQRAMETARRLTGRTPLAVPALIEQDWGTWEGRRLEEIHALPDADGLEGRAPGGESMAQVIARLRPWLAGIDRPTVAVAHKGILQALLALATGWDNQGKPPVKIAAYAGLHFHLTGGLPRLVAANLPLEPR